ncbi:hypothetical protein J4G33_12115 [Actinotalea sp. BY-33]|uniref:Uncharacterized protein n=1 Tax=Actinotalea soli TaxID=2819234 RepID=A0A939LR84_9CELL|nr:hypothetical protein [Actinotalea soli]MBO1752548.1 hypothetical protein [Actinotalea soli]
MSTDPHLYDSVREVLDGDPRFIHLDDHLHCDGSSAPLTNIYPVDVSPVEWEGGLHRSHVAGPAGDVGRDLRVSLTGMDRGVGRLVASRLVEPLWIVDSTETAGPAGAVDPDRVALA